MKYSELGVALLALSLLGARAAGQTQPTTEYQELLPSDATHGLSFGADVAIDGDTLVVGSIGKGAGGAVYIYRRNGATWGNEVQLPGQPGSSIFGNPVDLDGSILVVGDTDNTNANGQSAGAAFVYSRVGNAWVFEQKLLASTGTQFDNFTNGLALAGTTIVAGAPGANGVAFLSGSAYVFEKVGSTWHETQVLAPSRGHSQANFGGSVAIDASGDRILVGSKTESFEVSNGGAAYVFKRVGSSWVEEARISDPNAISSEFFGGSVGIDGDRLIVGADANDDVATNAGTAWIFERSGTDWIPITKLYASDAFAQYRFGYRVGLRGDTAIVSAYSTDPVLYKIYQFQRSPGGWFEQAILGTSDQAPFDGFAENFDYEGGSVLASGAIGAWKGPIRPGAAYVHVLDVPAAPYCTGKVNSQGCLPAISDVGTPSTTGPDDYAVVATNVLGSKPGLYFYGLQGPLAAPFFNGTLCVTPPLFRTSLQLSSAAPACGGTYSFPLTQAFMAAAGMFPGTSVHGQYWMRDPDHPDGTGVGLSDALTISIQL